MYPRSIQKLIEMFSKFPTIGPRTAARFVFYILRAPQKEVEELIEAIKNVKEEIAVCTFCFNPFEVSEDVSSTKLCSICRDRSRDSSLLCVVEKESDLEAIESTKHYRGLYFILGGTVGTLERKEFKGIRGEALKKRIQNPQNFGLERAQFKEIILATNLTTEGEATALFLERELQPLGITITRLGRGLPIGAELEYADEETLKNAFEGRR